jgi:hypothetical protein
MASLNHHILHSNYEFKEDSPLKEYLKSRVPTLRESHTRFSPCSRLSSVMATCLMKPTRSSSVETPPPLAAALGTGELYAGDIRDVVYRQLMLRSACPWSPQSGRYPEAVLTGPGSERTLRDGTVIARPEVGSARKLAQASGAPNDLVAGPDVMRPITVASANVTRLNATPFCHRRCVIHTI